MTTDRHPLMPRVKAAHDSILPPPRHKAATNIFAARACRRRASCPLLLICFISGFRLAARKHGHAAIVVEFSRLFQCISRCHDTCFSFHGKEVEAGKRDAHYYRGIPALRGATLPRHYRLKSAFDGIICRRYLIFA